jgi:hypothetical protein
VIEGSTKDAPMMDRAKVVEEAEKSFTRSLKRLFGKIAHLSYDRKR